MHGKDEDDWETDEESSQTEETIDESQLRLAGLREAQSKIRDGGFFGSEEDSKPQVKDKKILTKEEIEEGKKKIKAAGEKLFGQKLENIDNEVDNKPIETKVSEGLLHGDESQIVSAPPPPPPPMMESVAPPSPLPREPHVKREMNQKQASSLPKQDQNSELGNLLAQALHQRRASIEDEEDAFDKDLSGDLKVDVSLEQLENTAIIEAKKEEVLQDMPELEIQQENQDVSIQDDEVFAQKQIIDDFVTRRERFLGYEGDLNALITKNNRELMRDLIEHMKKVSDKIDSFSAGETIDTYDVLKLKAKLYKHILPLINPDSTPEQRQKSLNKLDGFMTLLAENNVEHTDLKNGLSEFITQVQEIRLAEKWDDVHVEETSEEMALKIEIMLIDHLGEAKFQKDAAVINAKQMIVEVNQIPLEDDKKIFYEHLMILLNTEASLDKKQESVKNIQEFLDRVEDKGVECHHLRQAVRAVMLLIPGVEKLMETSTSKELREETKEKIDSDLIREFERQLEVLQDKAGNLAERKQSQAASLLMGLHSVLSGLKNDYQKGDITKNNFTQRSALALLVAEERSEFKSFRGIGKLVSALANVFRKLLNLPIKETNTIGLIKQFKEKLNGCKQDNKSAQGLKQEQPIQQDQKGIKF